MLTPYQIELIHREIDGENSPEASAEVQKLVEAVPDALALMTSLKSLDALFAEVPDRAPHPRVKVGIYNAVSLNSRASPTPAHPQGAMQMITRFVAKIRDGFTNIIGEPMLTKKVLIGATTAVAVIAIIGYAVVDYTPSVSDAGTVGATGMSGVQQASRFKAHPITQADVTLSNPEIMALFQNDKILKLVKSEIFHEAMHDNAFRDLTASEQFHSLESSETFHDLMASEQMHDLMANDAYEQLMASDAFEQLMANEQFVGLFRDNPNRDVTAMEVYHDLQASAVYHDLMSAPIFHELMANEQFRDIMANDQYRDLFANETFHDIMANEQYRVLFANEQFRDLFANEAFRDLQANELFRDLSHDVSLMDLFLNEANQIHM